MIENKKVLIRADGNAQIGAGHLMRCLTIADAFAEKEQIGFVCADEDSAAVAEAKGYESWVLHTDYKDMMQELPYWESLSGKNRVLLIDSYYVTNPYLQNLHKIGHTVLLDDMAENAWDVDAVVNYNAFATARMYEALNGPYENKYYLGGAYIPVRKEFCKRVYDVKADAKNILITTGGGDSENIAGQILDRIWKDGYEYHVVTGRFNPHYETLVQKAVSYPNIHIHHDVQDMAALMVTCDVAVTAGGTTVYELSSLGVPFVCFSYAKNQELLVEYIGKEGIAGCGGAFHKEPEKTLKTIEKQVEHLMQDKGMRLEYSHSERKLVDGLGAERIAKLLCDLVKEKSE